MGSTTPGSSGHQEKEGVSLLSAWPPQSLLKRSSSQSLFLQQGRLEYNFDSVESFLHTVRQRLYKRGLPMYPH